MTRQAHEHFDALTVALQPGSTLVEASAGTGKTFAITRLLLRLLLEEKVDSLARILVVTLMLHLMRGIGTIHGGLAKHLLVAQSRAD